MTSAVVPRNAADKDLLVFTLVQTLFGPDNQPPLSSEEAAEVKQNARQRVAFWRKRFLYSCLALLLSIAAGLPFLAGYPLDGYFHPFGRVLLYLSLGMFIGSLYHGLLWWGAWKMLRELG
jgi:hypothetical protein